MTDTPLVSTWPTRDFPILKGCLRAADAGERYADLEKIREEIGLGVTDMDTGLRALESASPPFISVRWSLGDSEHVVARLVDVSERARRELGTWPSPEDVVDRMAAALSQAADEEQEPERKSRLRSAADGLVSFGRQVAVEVVSRQIGSV